MSLAAIEMVSVRKRFAGARGLEDLSLAVPSGGVFGILGPNGAGKTTTLRILLGLLRADEGSVRVLGLDPIVEGRRVREALGVLLETDGLYERLTAIENLVYHARIRRLGDAAPARVEELLRSFDLWDRRGDVVVTFSKGMRQKLAIARALLHRPKLLLLDEPFTGLDPAAAVELRARIGGLAREEETTVVMTTHDLAHVERSCDEVAVIAGGRVLARGAPERLGKGGANEIEVRGEGLSEAVLEALEEEGIVTSFRFDGTTARVTCEGDGRKKLGARLVAHGVAIEELHAVKGSLEEAFLRIVGGEGAPS